MLSRDYRKHHPQKNLFDWFVFQPVSYVYLQFPSFPTLNEERFPSAASPRKDGKLKHIIYFNGRLFREEESASPCGRSRNYQSPSVRADAWDARLPNDSCYFCCAVVAAWAMEWETPGLLGNVHTNQFGLLAELRALLECSMIRSLLGFTFSFWSFKSWLSQTHWLWRGSKLVTLLDVGRCMVSGWPQLWELT